MSSRISSRSRSVLEVGLSEGRGEVEDRAGGRGDGDRPVRGHLVGSKVARAVDAQPRALVAAGAGDGDVGEDRPALAQSPQRARRGVAQRGARPAGEHGGHPPAVGTERRVPDGVDAAMDDVQPPGRHTAIDRTGGEAERPELPARDDAVLARRERRDARVDGGFDELTSIIEIDSSTPLHAVEDADRIRGAWGADCNKRRTEERRLSGSPLRRRRPRAPRPEPALERDAHERGRDALPRAAPPAHHRHPPEPPRHRRDRDDPARPRRPEEPTPEWPENAVGGPPRAAAATHPHPSTAPAPATRRATMPATPAVPSS